MVIGAPRVGSGGLVVGVILLVINPLLRRLLAQEAQERVIISVTAIAIFLSSTITGIGELHPVFGAFMAGILLPDKVRHMAANLRPMKIGELHGIKTN